MSQGFRILNNMYNVCLDDIYSHQLELKMGRSKDDRSKEEKSADKRKRATSSSNGSSSETSDDDGFRKQKRRHKRRKNQKVTIKGEKNLKVEFSHISFHHSYFQFLPYH